LAKTTSPKKPILKKYKSFIELALENTPNKIIAIINYYQLFLG
jgi:hypothetical protein